MLLEGVPATVKSSAERHGLPGLREAELCPAPWPSGTLPVPDSVWFPTPHPSAVVGSEQWPAAWLRLLGLAGGRRLLTAAHSPLFFTGTTSQLVPLSKKTYFTPFWFSVEKLPFAHAESQWKMSSHFEFARIWGGREKTP